MMKLNAPRRPSARGGPKTISERLFERYLRALEVPFEFEAASDAKHTRPDFCIALGDQFVFCEVKELRERSAPPALNCTSEIIRVAAKGSSRDGSF